MANLPQKTHTCLSGTEYRLTSLPALPARALLIELVNLIGKARVLGAGSTVETAFMALVSSEQFERFYQAFEPVTEARVAGNWVPVVNAGSYVGAFGDMYEVMEAHLRMNFQSFFDRFAALRAQSPNPSEKS